MPMMFSSSTIAIAGTAYLGELGYQLFGIGSGLCSDRPQRSRRVSVGLENPDELWEDLTSFLEAL